MRANGIRKIIVGGFYPLFTSTPSIWQHSPTYVKFPGKQVFPDLIQNNYLSDPLILWILVGNTRGPSSALEEIRLLPTGTPHKGIKECSAAPALCITIHNWTALISFRFPTDIEFPRSGGKFCHPIPSSPSSHTHSWFVQPLALILQGGQVWRRNLPPEVKPKLYHFWVSKSCLLITPNLSVLTRHPVKNGPPMWEAHICFCSARSLLDPV